MVPKVWPLHHAQSSTPRTRISWGNAGRRAALAWLVALVVVAGAVTTADATAPGANGSISFRRFFDASQETGAVFAIAADGKGERQITTPPTGGLDDQPDWAPDGSLIAFTRCAGRTLPCHVFVVAPDGTGLARHQPADVPG